MIVEMVWHLSSTGLCKIGHISLIVSAVSYMQRWLVLDNGRECLSDRQLGYGLGEKTMQLDI